MTATQEEFDVLSQATREVDGAGLVRGSRRCSWSAVASTR